MPCPHFSRLCCLKQPVLNRAKPFPRIFYTRPLESTDFRLCKRRAVVVWSLQTTPVRLPLTIAGTLPPMQKHSMLWGSTVCDQPCPLREQHLLCRNQWTAFFALLAGLANEFGGCSLLAFTRATWRTLNCDKVSQHNGKAFAEPDSTLKQLCCVSTYLPMAALNAENLRPSCLSPSTHSARQSPRPVREQERREVEEGSAKGQSKCRRNRYCRK